MAKYFHPEHVTDSSSPIFQELRQSRAQKRADHFYSASCHCSGYLWISFTLFVGSNKIYPLKSDRRGKSTPRFRISNQVLAMG